MGEQVEVTEAASNTDREIWRREPGDYYSPSIHVTAQGAIGINVGGSVIVRSIEEWNRLAVEAAAQVRVAELEAALVAHNCGTPGCLCWYACRAEDARKPDATDGEEG